MGKNVSETDHWSPHQLSRRKRHKNMWVKRCSISLKYQYLTIYIINFGWFARDHFVYAHSLWEMVLHCNVISHWLGTYSKWSLFTFYVSGRSGLIRKLQFNSSLQGCGISIAGKLEISQSYTKPSICDSFPDYIWNSGKQLQKYYFKCHDRGNIYQKALSNRL